MWKSEIVIVSRMLDRHARTPTTQTRSDTNRALRGTIKLQGARGRCSQDGGAFDCLKRRATVSRCVRILNGNVDPKMYHSVL